MALMLNMADVRAGVVDLERFFQGNSEVTSEDARQCVFEINAVIGRMAGGIRRPDKGTDEVHRDPGASEAMQSVNALGVAVQHHNAELGLAACSRIREI